MMRWPTNGRAAVVSIAVMLAISVAGAMAQQGPPAAGAPPPGGAPPDAAAFAGRAFNGSYPTPAGAGTRKESRQLPDFSGLWMKVEGLQHPDQTKILPFMKAEAAADWRRRIAASDFHVPWSFCEPTAFPAMMTESGLPFELLMTTGRVTMLMPDGAIRSIYTDGSEHPQPNGGLYYGNSIGSWEGDTLVVETTDLRAENNVVMGLEAGTEQMKVVERLRLVGPDRLQNELSVSGPGFLKEPYRYTQQYLRRRDLRLDEFVCLPSRNRNNGRSVDLTPPAN